MGDPTGLLYYLSIFVLPFVQEDAAVLYAAVNASMHANLWVPIFLTIWAGLCASDLWKYWIGWYALKHPKARRFAEKDKVTAFKDKVTQNAFSSLLTVRFIPFARVPAYVACGFFGVKYWLYSLAIIISALLYTIVIFLIVHFLGEVFHDKLKWMLPAIAITIMALYWLSRYALKRYFK